MGHGVVDGHPLAKQTWVEADEALGFSLSSLVVSGPDAALTLTENAQPAILAYSTALFRVLQAERPGCVPTMAAGHSLGEYSALVAADSLDFADALRLVRLRGQAMQEAVPSGEGGMLAVTGLSAERLLEICEEFEQARVEVAAFNSPVQSVVAGPLAALEEFRVRAEKEGARRCTFLNVSAPFHTSMLSKAGERLGVALESLVLREPRFPVFQNTDAGATCEPERIKEKLVQQVSVAVRWVECVQAMQKRGAEDFVEIGPGRSLTGLIKKCDRTLRVRFTDRSAFLEQF